MAIEESTIKQLIENAIPDAEVDIRGDGSHFQARVVSPAFDGVRAVKKQQMVYAALADQIADGSIHALTIKAYTPEEWATASKLQVAS